jgi:hypothetical protein
MSQLNRFERSPEAITESDVSNVRFHRHRKPIDDLRAVARLRRDRLAIYESFTASRALHASLRFHMSLVVVLLNNRYNYKYKYNE